MSHAAQLESFSGVPRAMVLACWQAALKVSRCKRIPLIHCEHDAYFYTGLILHWTKHIKADITQT